MESPQYPRCFRELFVFDPSRIPAYMSGERQVDCTTIARAAEAGELEFVQWCRAQGHCIDSTALGYALKARQRAVVLWMLEPSVMDWDVLFSPYNRELLQCECLQLDIPHELTDVIPELPQRISDFYAALAASSDEGEYAQGLCRVPEKAI